MLIFLILVAVRCFILACSNMIDDQRFSSRALAQLSLVGVFAAIAVDYANPHNLLNPASKFASLPLQMLFGIGILVFVIGSIGNIFAKEPVNVKDAKEDRSAQHAEC